MNYFLNSSNLSQVVEGIPSLNDRVFVGMGKGIGSGSFSNYPRGYWGATVVAVDAATEEWVIRFDATYGEVCEPFEEHLFTRVKNAMIKTAVRKIKSEKAKAVYGLDEQTILKTLRNFARETCGYCLIRCYFKKLSNPQKWKIKVGHLGFRQANGDIFWSYG